MLEMLGKQAMHLMELGLNFKLLQDKIEEVEKRTRQAEDSENKLRAFFNSSLSCHILLGKEMEILAFNKAAGLFVKKQRNSSLKNGKCFLDFISTSYTGEFSANFRIAVSGKAVYHDQLIDYGDLGAIWWHLNFIPARDHQGEIIGISFNGTNINERKGHEENIRKKNERLEEIAWIQSHQVRSPVANILGLCDLFNVENTADPINIELLRGIKTSSNQLDGVIKEIDRKTKDT